MIDSRYKLKTLFFIAGFLLIVVIIITLGIKKNNRLPILEVSFLNIGQGDAILIDYLRHYQILIDGGPNGKQILTELSKVMPFMDNKIEVVIITHPDRDHFSGLIDVFKKYKIGLVLDNGQKSDDRVWRELYKIIKDKNISRQAVGEGSKLIIGKDFIIHFFNPDKIALSKTAKNDYSVVARLDFGINSFLFTGDAGFDAEADMIFDKEDLEVDWLKVGHHGSCYSTSAFFLARVKPKQAIISVGENKYGHPCADTLKRLQAVDSKVLRTDELGTIRVQCRNSQKNCQTFNK
jgi:competence protein ComEC